ncbi:SPFH domain-containing protein [Pseudoalteromonas sp. T1lg65]|uniref:prohibitin family protein n=1 Tax=Pseudoalteromonas sp. T1lg65 TaxID=2077101 RepID=UPI003F7A99C5
MNIVISSELALIIIIGSVLALILSNLTMRLLKRFKPRWHRRIRSWRFKAGISLLVFLFIFVALIKVIFVRLDSGQVGVLWKRLGGGTHLETHFTEGTVLVYPWDKLTIYSSRFQTASTKVYAITSEGLRITLDVTVRYRPSIKYIPYLHQLVGPDYLNEMILPEVGAAVRSLVSNFTAEDVYGKQRLKVQKELLDEVLAELEIQEQTILGDMHKEVGSHRLVNLDDMLIRRVDVPDKVHNAIISKVNQKYLNQEYDMRLEVADKEAERKLREAKGIANFQKEVSGGISETYLRWRGIEATLELAKSNNSKIVVIGSGKDGLPLILNTENSLAEPITNQLSEMDKQPHQQRKLEIADQAHPKGDLDK